MVIKQLQHWFIARANAARWKPIIDWVDDQDGQFKQMGEGQGFSIELGSPAGAPWRIEWGRSQRSYIDGAELRMRCELRLHPDLQMMVLEAELMESLEKQVFEAYTDTLRTRVDTDTPEEMRWLVMFPKLTHLQSKLVRSQFGVLGVTRELASAWVEGKLSEALAQSTQDLLTKGRPFVLQSLRGNLYLRLAMAEPTLPELQGLYRLMKVAAESAMHVHQQMGEASPWPTTTSTTWHSQPGEAEDRDGR